MEMKHRQKHISLRCSNQGLTMVELLVAMVVSLLAMAAIYSTFLTQLKSYHLQEETADMQQNIRVAMYYMQKEIRMAGCDPQRKGSFGFIQTNGDWANANSIRFSEDVNDGAGGLPDGVLNANETIQYNLNDSDGDLVNDELVRNGVTVAQNIDAIDFVYFDGADPPVRLNPFSGGPTNVSATNYDNIRSVEITIVARTDDPLLSSSTSRTYVNQQGDTIWVSPNDNVSRRRLTVSLRFRNLGL